jgi:hypothetical protein
MTSVRLEGGWQADLGAGFVDAAVPGCWEQLGGSKRFTGPVTYRRELDCPVPRDGERVSLSFGGVSYSCSVSVNGRAAGAHEGMWDGFRVDITDHVRPGARNEIRLVVEKPGYADDDRYPLRAVLSGFIPDVTCTFGGIWGDVDLEVGPAVAARKARMRWKAGPEIHIEVVNDGATGIPADVTVSLSRDGRESFAARRTIHAGPGLEELAFPVPRDAIEPWRTEQPVLYDLSVLVASSAGEAVLRRRIGFREIRADQERILLNGEPIYLRGALHWGYYPDRIVPRPSRDEIRRELLSLRSLGFNAVKHCLWVPREEYYELCDELGMLAWLELPLWLPRMSPRLEARMAEEYPRIVRQAAGHPCIIAWSLGCELNADVAGAVLEKLAAEVRELTGCLVRDNSGSGECYGGLAVDYSDFYDYHFYAESHILESLMETFTPRWRSRRPWLFGEYADADTWREVPRGRAAPWWAKNDPDVNPLSILKPDFRLHLQPERLAAPGVAGRSGRLAAASREHAVLHRKLSLEATRAFGEPCGYNITAIRDVPIATSGIFDDAGSAKFEPDELIPFNADLVLVPRWDLARIWIRGDRVREPDRYNARAGEDWAMRIVASNFGPRIETGEWKWQLVDAAGARIASGFGTLDAALGCGIVRELCRPATKLPGAPSPRRLTLSVELRHAAGKAANSWPLFIWPGPVDEARLAGKLAILDPLGILEPLRADLGAGDFDEGAAGDVVVAATAFDERLRRHVTRGGRALLVQRGRGALAHETVGFWREGFAVFEDHPVADAIPAGPYRELALYGMATDTALTWISRGGDVRGVRPVITRVDAREFIAQHYLVELSLGKGTLVATTLRVEGGMGRQPAGIGDSSAARFLVDRILRYLLAS